MPTIKILPSGKEIKVKKGTEILEAVHLVELPIEASCGGEGTCGDCVVKVISGEIEVESYGELSNPDIEDGYILACKSRIASSSLVIELSKKNEQLDEKKFTDLSEDERDELKTLYEEYTQYYNDFVRQIFSFDDWVNHTHNKDISDLKWRTFKINKTKILD